MSRFIDIAVIMLVLLSPSRAEEQSAAASGIIIGSRSEDARPARQCVEVQIGIDVAPLHCLNQALKQKVDRIRPPAIDPPLNAQSQDTRIGVVNSSAIRQQYGKNFGISVIPQGAQRPAPRPALTR